MFRRRSDVYLDILELIPAQDCREQTTAQIGARVRARMEDVLS